MITEIKIKGYKSIKNQQIKLRPVNILLGGNGVGKSNFISVFSFIRHILNKNLQNYVELKGGADNFLHFGKKHTNRIDLDFCFGDKNNAVNRFLLSLEEARDSLFIRSVDTAFYYTKWHPNHFESNVKETDFANMQHGQSFWVNMWLREFDVYHFHDTGDTSPMKGKCNINDNSRLKKNGSNIAAFLYFLKLKHPKHYLRIEKTVQSVAPFFEKFILEPSKLNEEIIQLEWKEKGFPDAYFNAFHLSDGTLRFICLVTLLMQPELPGTIIIDEPELGLHPVAINKLAALIRKASTNAQVIVSTQSINFIDNFGPEDIIVTNRRSNCTEFKRLEASELQVWLEEYTMGDIWGKNLIGAQPYDM